MNKQSVINAIVKSKEKNVHLFRHHESTMYGRFIQDEELVDNDKSNEELLYEKGFVRFLYANKEDAYNKTASKVYKMGFVRLIHITQIHSIRICE